MRGVGILPRVPDQRHREVRQLHGEVEGGEALAQMAGVAFGHGGDEVGVARQGEGGGEAAHDGGDVAGEAVFVQGIVDAAVRLVAPGDEDVARLGEEFRGDAAFHQAVMAPHHAHEAVAEEAHIDELGA